MFGIVRSAQQAPNADTLLSILLWVSLDSIITARTHGVVAVPAYSLLQGWGFRTSCRLCQSGCRSSSADDGS